MHKVKTPRPICRTSLSGSDTDFDETTPQYRRRLKMKAVGSDDWVRETKKKNKQEEILQRHRWDATFTHYLPPPHPRVSSSGAFLAQPEPRFCSSSSTPPHPHPLITEMKRLTRRDWTANGGITRLTEDRPAYSRTSVSKESILPLLLSTKRKVGLEVYHYEATRHIEYERPQRLADQRPQPVLKTLKDEAMDYQSKEYRVMVYTRQLSSNYSDDEYKNLGTKEERQFSIKIVLRTHSRGDQYGYMKRATNGALDSNSENKGIVRTEMELVLEQYAHNKVIEMKSRISELTPKDLEGPTYEIVKVFHPNVVHLQFQMEECHKLLTDKVDDAILKYNVSKPLPLGGEPGHITIQSDFFFNKDLEYLRYGRKIGRPALSISKMKVAFYLDVGLEQLVPDQFWIEEECKYDIAAMYGISHWWFQRKRFYIDRFSSEGDRRAVRTHMRILSVIRIEVFSLYGYNYMKKMEILLEPTSNKLLEILLKMNLPDHRSVLTDPEDQAKMEMETPRSSGVNSPPNAHT
ncbi:hypothetical protein Tco_0253112 [Tanacetum coccineum]